MRMRWHPSGPAFLQPDGGAAAERRPALLVPSILQGSAPAEGGGSPCRNPLGGFVPAEQGKRGRRHSGPASHAHLPGGRSIACHRVRRTGADDWMARSCTDQPVDSIARTGLTGVGRRRFTAVALVGRARRLSADLARSRVQFVVNQHKPPSTPQRPNGTSHARRAAQPPERRSALAGHTILQGCGPAQESTRWIPACGTSSGVCPKGGAAARAPIGARWTHDPSGVCPASREAGPGDPRAANPLGGFAPADNKVPPVNEFLERLRSGPPLVADGGMGALIAATAPGLRCPEEANVRAPESVVAVHASYIAAGAELIETNTFGATRRKLARLMLEDELRARSSRRGRASRARRARSQVATCSSPARSARSARRRPSIRRRTGRCTPRPRRCSRGAASTSSSSRRSSTSRSSSSAVEAVRAVSSLPIVAMLTFDEEAETTGGIGAAAAAARLARLDVAAIGTNHGAGPSSALAVLARMQDAGPAARCAAQRRPREPRRRPRRLPTLDDRVLRRVRRPGDRARRADHRRLLRHHARADRGDPRVGGRGPRAVRRVRAGRGVARPATVAAAEEETALARALRDGEWVVSVELDPPKGGSLEGLVAVTRTLHDAGRSAFVDVNDNPMARARMNALMTSATLQRETGVETIPHVTPRDATVMGLEGLLLGAHAEGVRNLLAVTGDPPNVGDYPGSHGVYELDSIGLVEVVSALNRGSRLHGQGARRADLVLLRRRRQPDRRRPRRRARPLPPQGGGGRAVRDDPGALRARLARAVRRAARRLAGAGAARRLAAAQPVAGAPSPQRGSRDLGARRGARRASTTPAPTRRGSGSSSPGRSSTRRAAAWRGST